MRILLVEDEEKVSHPVSRGLAAEHYAVDTAFDSAQKAAAALKAEGHCA